MTLCTRAAGGTHIGLVRRCNEDSFALLPRRGLFMVADGVGGHVGGEVASNMVVQGVRGALEDDPLAGPPPASVNGDDAARLVRAVRAANQRVYETGFRELRLQGMATTFVGALVTDSGVHIAHVGDSRAYRLRDGFLQRLTEDHTLLGELRRQGVEYIDLLDELSPRLSGKLTRAVGLDPTVDVETRVEQPQAGDVLLLCSDGLYGAVPEDEIEAVLARDIGEAAAVLELIELALRHGGPDNVTCIVVRFAAA